MPIIQFLTCGAAVMLFEDLSLINQTQEDCCNCSSRFPCVLLGNNFKEKKIWHNRRSYFKILRKKKSKKHIQKPNYYEKKKVNS